MNSQETKPVAWVQPDHLEKARVAPFLCRVEPTKRMADFVPIYAAPQSREPLTDEQIDRHTLLAQECPPGSKVILVSSLRRLRAHGIMSKP